MFTVPKFRVPEFRVPDLRRPLSRFVTELIESSSFSSWTDSVTTSQRHLTRVITDLMQVPRIGSHRWLERRNPHPKGSLPPHVPGSFLQASVVAAPSW